MQLLDRDLQLLSRPAYLRLGDADQLFSRKCVVKKLLGLQRHLIALVDDARAGGIDVGVRTLEIPQTAKAGEQVETQIEPARIGVDRRIGRRVALNTERLVAAAC